MLQELFKITMSQKDLSQNQNFNPLIKNRHHLQFNNVARVNSLKKFQSCQSTFTPDIHQLPFQIYPERTKTQVSKQQIIERLLDSRREKAESLRAQKAKKEELEYNEHCTFQPTISQLSKKITNKQNGDSKQAHQRLYEEGLSRIKNVNECTEDDKENCTFHPNIGKDRSEYQSCLAPIYQRIEQIISDKKQSLKRLQSDQYMSQTREKPQINFKTNQIIQKKSDFKKNVLERLFNHLKQKNNKIQKLAEERKLEVQKQCTFQPTVNYNPDSFIDQNFLDRQEREAEKTREKLIYLQERDQASFQPSINKLSSLLVEAERVGQSETQRIDRLHCEPFLQRKAEMERIQEEIYKQCTFQPQINPISKGLQGVPHTHRCACHPKQEHYQFHPQINPKSRQMAMRAKPKQQGQAVEQARLQLQYREMRECTFRPKTQGDRYKSMLHKKSLKQIPGADSYQQRILKAKAKRTEEQKIKQKLFEIQKRYVQHKQTKFEPFKLSEGQRKISKLKQSAEEQFQKQHPFRPQILVRMR